MGKSAHLSASASASQIYPINSSSTTAYVSPALTPPHSSHSSTSRKPSDFALNPLAPTDEHGSNLARRVRILDIARLALAVLSVGAAAAVVGCEAHTLSVYNGTRLADGFFVPPLWPRDFDLRPTLGLVVGGSVVAFVGLVYLACGFVPVATRFNLLRILFSVSLAVVGLAGSVVGVAYSSHITNRPGYDRDNIQSWTCRWVDGAADVEKLFAGGMAAIAAPQGFKRMCTESHVGFSLLAILICLETVVLMVTGWCAWMEVKMRRAERDLASDDMDEKNMPGRGFY